MVDGRKRKRRSVGEDTLGKAKKKKRTCRKCGEPSCKGAGMVKYCENPCRDCQKVNCEGRNPQHPGKPCHVGWGFYHNKARGGGSVR